MTGAPYQTKRDRFKSSLSGREYPFAADFDGTSRRAALAQLEADDRRIMAANDDRALRLLGRPLSTREHLYGGWEPDQRTLREKVAQDGTLTSQPKPDPDANPHERRLAELRSRNFRTRDEKAQIARRVEWAQRDSAAWQAARAVVREHEAKMNSPQVKDALVDAGAWLTRLQTNPSVAQAWVDRAAKRLSDLKASGDTDTYWKLTLAFEAEREATLTTQANDLDDLAEKMRGDASAVRRGEPVTPTDAAGTTQTGDDELTV